MLHDLHTFTDYRAFLLSFSDKKKAESHGWSLSLWSKRLGLNATSSLTKVLNGEREAGDKIVVAFIRYFNFNTEEEIFFRDLVRLSKLNSDPLLKLAIQRALGTIHPTKTIKIMEDRVFGLLSKWSCFTIREMIKLKDFKNSPEWIQKRLAFKASVSEIEKDIELLHKQGFIEFDSKGRMHQKEGLLETRNDSLSIAIQNYHRQMLENARLALKEQTLEQREFTSETFCIKEKNIPQAKELIRKFKADFCRTLEADDGDQTYQLQIQFFSLTKDIK